MVVFGSCGWWDQFTYIYTYLHLYGFVFPIWMPFRLWLILPFDLTYFCQFILRHLVSVFTIMVIVNQYVGGGEVVLHYITFVAGLVKY